MVCSPARRNLPVRSAKPNLLEFPAEAARATAVISAQPADETQKDDTGEKESKASRVQSSAQSARKQSDEDGFPCRTIAARSGDVDIVGGMELWGPRVRWEGERVAIPILVGLNLFGQTSLGEVSVPWRR